MVNDQIEVLRERLNNMLDTNDVNKEELLRVSEELDVLIVNSMREQQKKEKHWLLLKKSAKALKTKK